MTMPQRARKPPSKRIKKPILPSWIIVCEGQLTEIKYFNIWRNEFRDKVNIEPIKADGTDPGSIVSTAKRLKREFRDLGPGLRIWCVGDLDSNSTSTLKHQMDLAKASRIEYLLSVPCFELWLILHFQDFFRPEDRFGVQRIRFELLNANNDRVSAKDIGASEISRIRSNIRLAVDRAQKLEDNHISSGASFPENPKSDVWKFFNELFRIYGFIG
jgi:hypothetical protein